MDGSSFSSQFYDRSRPPGSQKRCNVRCACGAELEVASNHLTNGHTSSCGCRQREVTLERNLTNNPSRTHGQWESPEWESWHAIGQRVNNPKHKSYHRYGGRGINLCKGFQSVEYFLSEVGKRPTDHHSIDRINNDGNYSCGKCPQCLANGWPLNVRWATKKEQSRNRHDNVRLTIDGVTKTQTEWSEISGKTSGTIRRRKLYGLSDKEAVFGIKRLPTVSQTP